MAAADLRPPTPLLSATCPPCLASCNSPLRQKLLPHQLGGGRGEGEAGRSCWRARRETAGKQPAVTVPQVPSFSRVPCERPHLERAACCALRPGGRCLGTGVAAPEPGWLPLWGAQSC